MTKLEYAVAIILIVLFGIVIFGQAQTFQGFGDNVVASNKAYEQAPAFNGSVSLAFQNGVFKLSNNLK